MIILMIEKKSIRDSEIIISMPLIHYITFPTLFIYQNQKISETIPIKMTLFQINTINNRHVEFEM
jgi:hypothetical protein